MRTPRIVTIILAVLALTAVTNASDPNDGLTVWAGAADGADHLMEFRLGYERKFIEPGFAMKYYTAQPEWGPAPDAMGGYIAIHIDEILNFRDSLPDSEIEQWLHTLIGRPYGMVQAMIPTQGEQRNLEINWLAGTLFSTEPDFKWAVAVEYQVGQGVTSDADSLILLSMRIKF